jgi:hypothetical protein
MAFDLPRCYPDAGSFGDPIHHLEVAVDGCGVEERLGAQLVDDGFASWLLLRLVASEESIDQRDQLVSAFDAEFDVLTTDGSDIDVVSKGFAAPTEPPCVTEYSVETPIEQRDSRCHSLQLRSVETGLASEVGVTHLFFSHVHRTKHGPESVSFSRDQVECGGDRAGRFGEKPKASLQAWGDIAGWGTGQRIG